MGSKWACLPDVKVHVSIPLVDLQCESNGQHNAVFTYIAITPVTRVFQPTRTDNNNIFTNRLLTPGGFFIAGPPPR